MALSQKTSKISKKEKEVIMDGKVKKKKKTKLGTVQISEIEKILQGAKISDGPKLKKRKKQKKDLEIRQDKISKKKTLNTDVNKNQNAQSPSKKKKNKKQHDETKNNALDQKETKHEKLKQKIQPTLNTTQPSTRKSKKAIKSLRVRMLEKLQAARFRYINEEIYSSDSKETQKLFTDDPDSFHAYHEGYQQQVNKWPLNPLSVIIKSVQQLPQTHIIADFGCGEATLAKSVKHKVHSFDLIAKNEFVTACDMAHVPLQKGSVDVVVFCLSLMGTNLIDYLLEANRVLKEGGILKIAEVESRFENINKFIDDLKKFHFKLTWKDLSHNLFYFLDFKKHANIQNKKRLPAITLNPCLYKKR